MAVSLKCADMGKLECPGSFTVETDDELWKHVGMHAAESHPDLEMTPEVMAMAQGVVVRT